METVLLPHNLPSYVKYRWLLVGFHCQWSWNQTKHATVKIPPEGSSSSLKSSFIKRVTAQRQVPRLLSIVNQQFNILISHWQFLRLCIEILAFCFVFYLGDSLTQLWSKISSKSGPRKSIEFCQKYQKCNIIVLIYIEVISFS